MFFDPLLRRRAIVAARAHAQLLGHNLTPFYDEHGQDTPRRIACCQHCGMKAYLDNRPALYGPDGEALSSPCDGNGLRAIESRAWLTGHIPSLLLRRLQQEVSELPADWQAQFAPGHFEPSQFALYSEDGVWCLKWFLRGQPDVPIAGDNRQSPCGLVELKRVVPAHEMRDARYVGPRLNPNLGEAQEHWLFQPLLHGEQGVGYKDSQGHWRFRRAGGVVGYYVSPDNLVQLRRIRESPRLTESLPLGRLTESEKYGDIGHLYVPIPTPVLP